MTREVHIIFPSPLEGGLSMSVSAAFFNTSAVL